MMFHFDKRGTGGLGFLNTPIRDKRISLGYERTNSGFRVHGKGDPQIAEETGTIAELLTSGARERETRVPFAFTRRVKKELIGIYAIEVWREPYEDFEEVGITLFPWGYNVFDNSSEATGALPEQRGITLIGEEDYQITRRLLISEKAKRWPNRGFVETLTEFMEHYKRLKD